MPPNRHAAASAFPPPTRPAGKPSGKVAEAIDRDLGGYDKFVEAFKTAGAVGPPAGAGCQGNLVGHGSGPGHEYNCCLCWLLVGVVACAP